MPAYRGARADRRVAAPARLAGSGRWVKPRGTDPVFCSACQYGTGGLLFRASGRGGNARSRVAFRHLGLRVLLCDLRTGRPDWRFPRTLFLAAAASALFACVDFYFQFPAPSGFGPQYVWLDSGVYRRAQGLFYEASTLGNFCAFFLVMAAVALLRPMKEGFISRPALFGGAALFSTALVLSYSRASLLNVAIAISTLLWLQRRRFRFRQVGWAALPVTAAGAAAAYYLFPVFTRLYWDRLFGLRVLSLLFDRGRFVRKAFQLAGSGGLSLGESLVRVVRRGV